MFNSFYKLVVIRSRHLNPIQFYTQINQFCSKPISETTANYLINKFGFSQEKAISASKYLKFKSCEKPDSVVRFLEKRGLTDEQIGSIARHFPLILITSPEKTLLPKIEFFLSLGISQDEVNNIVLTAPALFRLSLKKQIIPAFTYIKSLFESSGKSFGPMKRLAEAFRCKLESQMIPNIGMLREVGVPDSKVIALLQYHPRSLMVDMDKFKEVVEEVMKMGFSPDKLDFVYAIKAFRAMNKSTWDKKKECYMKWGWSEDDVVLAFKTNPSCMMISTGKIMESMNFLVNEMGLSSSFLVQRTDILSFSLKARIKPRYSVYKILLKNGLIKEGSYLTIFNVIEEKFLKRFVHPYEEEVPGLLQLYQKELPVSES